MTQEIVDAVREIEREKGIETGTLVAALEDALLAAYKKTPGAARHATVEAGDPAADPRGRARDDVRRVHRPRQRGSHRHRPAGGRPQQRTRRPRQGRGAAPALRAGRR